MSMHKIAPLVDPALDGRARFLDLTAVPPTDRPSTDAGDVRRGELEAALRQEVRELRYTLRRALTVDGSAPDRSFRTTEAIEDLARAVLVDHEELRRQTERTSRYAVVLAEAAGCRGISSRDLRCAVLLHEVGRIGLRDGLVDAASPGRTERCDDISESTMVLDHAAAIAVASHEAWDGSGYPRGLRGTEIPEVARLAAVAQAFDTLTSRRRPGPPLAVEAAGRALRDLRGRQLEPRLVDALLGADGQIDAIRAAFPEEESTLADAQVPRLTAMPRPPTRQLGASLTRREMQVLGLVAAGLPNKQIALELGLRLNTVRNHVQNLLYKLRSHSKLEAVATAVREQLISYPAP